MSKTSQIVYHSIFSDYIYQEDDYFEYINAPYLEKADKNERFEFIQYLVNEIFEKMIPFFYHILQLFYCYNSVCEV